MSGRASIQIRADEPEPAERPHPRAVALARTAADIAAKLGFTPIGTFRNAGFSTAEVIEHTPAALRILDEGGPK